MDIRQFKDIVFKKAEELGFSEYEIYYSSNDILEVRIYESEVDGYELSNTMGVSFRGIINGKIGYSYSESLDEETAKVIVEKALENAELIEVEDKDFIYTASETYPELLSYNKDVEELKPEEQVNMALTLEKFAKESNYLIEKVAQCGIDTSKSEVAIINSKGLDLSHKKTNVTGYVVVVAKDGQGMKNGMSLKIGNSIKEIDLKKIANKAAENVIVKIGSRSIKSDKYKVLISNYMMANLLATFQGVFNADNAQKGLSLLKGKEGQTIASQVVTLVDDPLLENGLYSTPFDDEGVPTCKKYIIDKGEFKTLLHNLKTAYRDNVKTTGNASKASFSSPVTVSATNLCIQKGERSFDELVAIVEDGVYITDLQGMHSGANAITGDFSLAANGRVIRDGKLAEAIDQITVAGNFFQLLNDIEEIGSDLEFYNSNTASPSAIVSNLSIAGL